MDCWFHPVNSCSCCFLPSSPSPTCDILCLPFIQLKLKSACVLDAAELFIFKAWSLNPYTFHEGRDQWFSRLPPSVLTQRTMCEKHNGRRGDWKESVSSLVAQSTSHLHFHYSICIHDLTAYKDTAIKTGSEETTLKWFTGYLCFPAPLTVLP